MFSKHIFRSIPSSYFPFASMELFALDMILISSHFFHRFISLRLNLGFGSQKKKHMQALRKRFIEWLFEHSQNLYTKLFKAHNSWGISRRELLAYPRASFGWHLGKFLDDNGFELIPKVERHDAYHTLTGYGTKVQDEIALQCLCFGNGKRSLYLYGAMTLGILILPDYLRYYYKSFLIGKQANPFHHFDYSKLLKVNFETFRHTIFSQKTIHNIVLK